MEASALHAPAPTTRISLSASLLRVRTDEQLVALFRAGDEAAFGVIHDRYRARLIGYARQMLRGSRPDAEDAVQDVFMRTHAALRANGRPIALRAWLYRVAHNRCVDQLRRPTESPTDALERVTVDGGPEDETERKENLRRLLDDVRRLPDQQRSALLMRELEGLSYANLAVALDVTVPAVKSLLVRARIGLVEAAEARDTDCRAIRSDLALAHRRGVRSSGRTRRHLRDCAGCRDFRASMREVDRALASVPFPSPGLLAKALAVGGAGGGAAAGGTATGGGVAAGGGAAGGIAALGVTTAKVALVVATAAAAAGGAVAVHHGLDGGRPPPSTAARTPRSASHTSIANVPRAHGANAASLARTATAGAATATVSSSTAVPAAAWTLGAADVGGSPIVQTDSSAPGSSGATGPGTTPAPALGQGSLRPLLGLLGLVRPDPSTPAQGQSGSAGSTPTVPSTGSSAGADSAASGSPASAGSAPGASSAPSSADSSSSGKSSSPSHSSTTASRS